MPLSDEELAQAIQEWAEAKAAVSISWSKDPVARVLRDFVRSRGRWLDKATPSSGTVAPAKLRLPKWAAEAVVAPGIAPEPDTPEADAPTEVPALEAHAVRRDLMAPTEDPAMQAMRERLEERAQLIAKRRRPR